MIPLIERLLAASTSGEHTVRGRLDHVGADERYGIELHALRTGDPHTTTYLHLTDTPPPRHRAEDHDDTTELRLPAHLESLHAFDAYLATTGDHR